VFDLLLEAEVSGGRLVIQQGHIMPQSGTSAEAKGSLGVPGLRQLQQDLGAYFGVNVIEIPNTIGRTTGATSGFGPGSYPIR
jgi:hypothetical protein